LIESSDSPTEGVAEPAIRLLGVSKSFGASHVLVDFSLDVPAGQKLAVIGPSGSGKTTLLRLLMTLEAADSGSIRVFGEEMGLVAGHRPSRRHIRHIRSHLGMVFQHFNLFPHMTALDNVMVAPMHVMGLSRTEARERAIELLASVGLKEKLDAHPRQLSGGQQQRVAIARALAMEPQVMLFDEITSALDPELVGEVLAVVRRLAHASNMTMLIVTHEISFAKDVADRVIFIEGGRIVEDASPDVIFVNPASERTRSFLRAILER
jgi:polar amino acid transport system ATP-binding protein